MLENFTKCLEKFIKGKEEELMEFSLETVQGFFEMMDFNKNLKYNAISQEQLERVTNFENKINSIIEKLYVPDYQS